MSIFNTYRTKINNNKKCELKYEADFIKNSSASTIIHVLRTDIDKNAALTINDKEGPDNAIVFTFIEEDNDLNLLKGDYFTWKDKTFFIYEDEYLVHESYYQKQKAYECNIKFTYDDLEYDGYFIESLSKILNTSLVEDIIIEDNEKPLLIIPYFDWIKTGIKINIKNYIWKIIDFDILTNEKIAYIYLDRDFNTKFEDIKEEKPQNSIQAESDFEVNTFNSYFTSSSPVKIVFRNNEKIIFKVPFGIDEITITTKNEHNENIIETYKVVI